MGAFHDKMRELMSWEECGKKFIRKVTIDSEKIKSIVETARAREKFVNSIVVNKDNASFVFENHYEIIKELLTALMLGRGMRSQNHQCLITFLSKTGSYDAEAILIQQMNYLRNRLEYYGEQIEFNYYTENNKRFKEIIKLLFGLLK